MHAPTIRGKRRSGPAAFAAAVLAAAVALGGGLEPRPAAAEPAAETSEAFTEAPPSTTVTLITGDRVVFDSANPDIEPRVLPAEGREDLDFHILRHDGHLYVIPGDAQRLVDGGLLDRRLFDAAGLADAGYDDARTEWVPLMLTGGAAPGIAAASVEGTDVDVAAVPKEEAAQAWDDLTDGEADRTLADGLTGVWLDGRRELQLDESVPRIGAPEAWEAGFTGAGVTVAVLDSGVDAAHPDLADRITETRDFTGTGIDDEIGHGTHVASTISGTGAAGGSAYRGVAPGADLLVGKVCTDDGCTDSAILAGMQWAAESGADIVNLSLGGPDTPRLDPLEQAVDSLSDRYGTLFVVAAGNNGNDAPVDSPGSADAALTVGAVDGEDLLADFSSVGRTGDSGFKPDLTAPGVDITAARAADTWNGEPVDDRYITSSGTSMATPHVAGAAALLLQQHPDWTGAQVKAVLMGSAEPADGIGAFGQGAGRVDVAQAAAQSVYAEPASVSAGLATWPHGDDEPFVRQVTYRNTGDTEITLDLSLASQGPDGAAAPAGMFGLDRDAVTVPAGGDAAVTVTVDTAVEGPDGRYGAYLTATGDGVTVTTPVAVDREPERYGITVEALDREGAAADYGSVALLNLETGELLHLGLEGGPATVRVPPGEYHLDALFRFGPGGANMIRPLLEVTEDTEVTFDARDAGTAEFSFDHEGVVPKGLSEQYARAWAGGDFGRDVVVVNPANFYMGGTGEPVPDGELAVAIDGLWGIPGAAGDFSASPVLYQPVVLEYGQMPAGVQRHFRDEDMARIDADYRENTVAETAVQSWVAETPEGRRFYQSVAVAAPLQRTEFLTVVPGGRWRSEYSEADLDVPEGEPYRYYFLMDSFRDYEAGEAYAESWNAAVIGPGMPADGDLAFAERIGDQIGVSVPLFADAGSGRWGLTTLDSARTALYADGELVGESDSPGSGVFDVPAAAAEYRLETEAVRDGYAELSTRVAVAWEFASAHADGTTALPLMAVKLAPRGLDADNAADDRWTVVDLAVETRDGPVGDVEPTLEVSFDDGETWKAVDVCDFRASVRHPRGEGFVSLRATAEDADGNRVVQEVVRAYRYR